METQRRAEERSLEPVCVGRQGGAAVQGGAAAGGLRSELCRHGFPEIPMLPPGWSPRSGLPSAPLLQEGRKPLSSALPTLMQ